MAIFGFFYPLSEFVAWYFFIDRYSFWDAFLLCASTGLVGLYIVSIHGKALLVDMQLTPVDSMKTVPPRTFHRLMMIFGGLLLFIPGLVAKVAGTLLILPGVRHLLLWTLKGYVAEKLVRKGFDFVVSRGGNGSGFAGFAANFGSKMGPMGGPQSSRDVNAASSMRDVGGSSEVLDVTPVKIEHTDK